MMDILASGSASGSASGPASGQAIAMQLDTDKMVAWTDGPIGWMIFNNPARRNAVSLEMWQAVGTILEAFQGDDGIRVVVMAGAGDKAFVSGADISEFERLRDSAAAAEAYGRVSAEARAWLARFDKPLVAMIQGYCLGGGLGTALAADLRIASDDATFAIPAARLGLGYAFAGVKTLVDLVGPAVASDIFFTARRLCAAEALRVGLVNQVVAPGELEATVRATAETIAGNAPLTIKAAKRAVREVLADPASRDLDAVEALVRACFDSADYAEGRQAFMAKRPPKFEGR